MESTAKHTGFQTSGVDDEDIVPMALSTATRDWISKNGLEGNLQVADLPPHEEPEKAVLTIGIKKIFEGTV